MPSYRVSCCGKVTNKKRQNISSRGWNHNTTRHGPSWDVCCNNDVALHNNGIRDWKKKSRSWRRIPQRWMKQRAGKARNTYFNYLVWSSHVWCPATTLESFVAIYRCHLWQPICANSAQRLNGPLSSIYPQARSPLVLVNVPEGGPVGTAQSVETCIP